MKQNKKRYGKKILKKGYNWEDTKPVNPFKNGWHLISPYTWIKEIIVRSKHRHATYARLFCFCFWWMSWDGTLRNWCLHFCKRKRAKDSKGNILTVKKILYVNTFENVYGTVWRPCILMLGCKRFRHLQEFFFLVLLETHSTSFPVLFISRIAFIHKPRTASRGYITYFSKNRCTNLRITRTIENV